LFKYMQELSRHLCKCSLEYGLSFDSYPALILE
jgi:hypothetical protein